MSNSQLRTVKRWWISIIVLLCIGGVGYMKYFSAVRSEESAKVQRIQINKHFLFVEVADELNERVRGLQHREVLPANRGMIFVYPDERILRFWMKDTGIPLDIAYVDKEGVIREMYHMYPFNEEMISSQQAVQYAIEVNAGWFNEQGVSVGDIVHGLDGLSEYAQK